MQKTSAANSAYARIVTDDAELYADGSLTMSRFTIPKTYYVKVIEIGSDVTRVSYMGENTNLPLIEGYVKTVNLRFGDEPGASPYPLLTLTAISDDVLFADAEKQKPRCVISSGSAARYLGEKTVAGETLVYVYALGNVGYVSRSSFNDYTLPYHPDYIAEQAALIASAEAAAASAESVAAISSGKESKTSEPFAPSQVIIIALLIVGVLCVIFLLFRPEQKRSSQSAFYRDDDNY